MKKTLIVVSMLLVFALLYILYPLLPAGFFVSFDDPWKVVSVILAILLILVIAAFIWFSSVTGDVLNGMGAFFLGNSTKERRR